ncbi:sensor histidine kinase [Marinobacter subterrani]|uniref:histidine kinase n=1 Tax=Marinobacter subterrani TaxID=1658765 RepID=A0A0J7J381_9GAMM|nr:ATP-binding protein [Marinobacter subterrani]KMQ72908.1 Signal transduction histidine kinase [Marinobacter subterrani]
MLKPSAFAPRIHLRLLVMVLLLLSAGWLMLWFYLSSSAANTAAKDVDHQLNQAAFSLLMGLNQGLAGGDATGSTPERKPDELPEFELLSESGDVLVRSRRFPLTETQPGQLEAGYSRPRINGIPWRVLTVRDPANGRYVRVAVPLETVAQRGSELASAFVTPLLVALPVLGILVCLGIWQGLRPLRELSVKLSETEVDRLQPLAIDLKRVPREMQAPVLAINRLIRRVREAMASHRAFTSAMGHELRTPLAGFKSQVQVALRSDSQADKDRSLKKLAGAIDGMDRIVDHLLILARVDPVQPQLEASEIDLAALAEKCLTERESLMQAKSLTPELDLAGERLRMQGDATLIGSLIGNLLDNAARYSPVGGRVLVQIAASDGGLELRVSDQGPGIPEGQRAEVFENFHREPDQRKTGSGLGLGIVRAIAQAHGGSVELVDGPQQGACIRVWLPADGPSVVQTAVR